MASSHQNELEISEDIVVELLEIPEFEIICDLHDVCDIANKKSDASNEEIAHAMAAAGIGVSFELTEYGHQFVEKWLLNRNRQGNLSLEANIADYPLICKKINSFFNHVNSPIPINKFDGPKLLLSVIRSCSTKNSDAIPICEQEQITNIELETVEYLGGYVLKKATSKFPEGEDLLTLLKSDKPNGFLIELMEKKQGVLMYPSEKLVSVLKAIFNLTKKEIKKKVQDIDFKELSNIICKEDFAINFILWSNESLGLNHSTEKCHLIIVYMIKLFIRVLSYTFAKKKVSAFIKTNAKYSRGLRGDLKRKREKY